MSDFQDRFPPEGRKGSKLLLAEDWVFQVADYAALSDLAVVHQELSLCEAPLAVLRRISLAHPRRSSVTVQLDVALSLKNASDALDLLFAFANSFERPIPVKQVRNTADVNEVGDFGLAWSWSEENGADVVAFVRHNALVMLQGHHAEDRLLAGAHQIDTVLRLLKTVDAYEASQDGFFSQVRRELNQVPTIPTRGRLALGSALGATERYFFLTDQGSVNRSPESADGWYYRAGTRAGRREVRLFRVGPGILPKMERLSVDVQ